MRKNEMGEKKIMSRATARGKNRKAEGAVA
jgi:hypothetical protein